MIIDFSKVLSQDGKTLEVEAVYEQDSFKTNQFEYSVVDKDTVKMVLSNINKHQFKIEAETALVFAIPCSRCLEEVNTKIFINTSKVIDMNRLEDNECNDEEVEENRTFISEKTLDVDKFIYGEILVNLPMKVLCSEDCKGICNRCGTNLNHNTCGCDTTEPDPRMAKILDVFNSFKEV